MRVLLLAILSAAACRAPTDEPFMLSLLPANEAGAAAAVSGTLEARGPCLVLDTADGAINLAFAGDARWDGRALAFGGRTYAAGSRVTLSGARFEGDTARLAWVRAPAEACAARPWIVYSIDLA